MAQVLPGAAIRLIASELTGFETEIREITAALTP